MSLLTTLSQPRRRSSALPSMFDRVFGEFFEDPTWDRRIARPPMNVVETDTAYVLELELPGLDENDIQVQVTGDQLTINAERKFDTEKREGEYHRVEHHYGQFTRSLTLPRELDTKGIDASSRRGVLTVTLSKSEPTASKRIDVKGE